MLHLLFEIPLGYRVDDLHVECRVEIVREVIGTREATKRETRRALIEAALSEFAAKGFDAPSLDAICARAGYTRGAFYVHFSDRDELVSAAMEHAIGTLVDGIMRSDEKGAGGVVSTVERFVAFMGLDVDSGIPGVVDEEAPPFHKFLEACSRSDKVRRGMAQALERVVDRLGKTVAAGQASGTLRADIPAEGLATSLLLLALGVFSMNEIGLNIDVRATQTAVLRLFGNDG